MTETHFIYICAAYAVAGTVLAGVIAQSIMAWRKIRKQVEKLDA